MMGFNTKKMTRPVTEMAVLMKKAAKVQVCLYGERA
jgi:hypothetical protein